MKHDPQQDWIDCIPGPITVCNAEGIIVAMNRASRLNFKNKGGASLIGKSLYDCHPGSARDRIRIMLRDETTQTYIVESKGKKRLVHQSPWYKNKKIAGLVETIIDLSGEIEVRKRD